MADLKKIADAADFIVNGYAYTKAGGVVRVLNLNRPESAAVLTLAGEVMETSMDDIELKIVTNYWQRNRGFVEEQDA